LKHWEREVAFHGAGHYLHTIFWNNMIPHCGGEPKRGLNSQIIKDFGSISRFKKHFSTAAEKVEAVRLGNSGLGSTGAQDGNSPG
jgi:superoxide dismutase, Fe-Mn family